MTQAKSKKQSIKVIEKVPEAPVNTIALNDAALKAISALAASILFQAPQFTNQASPNNIVALADLLYRYMNNDLRVTQPSDTLDAGSPQQSAKPTFG